MKKILISFMMMLAYEAQAQTCIPTPDCAGLGYTATSCSGAFLRCPFDTTKMFCASGGGGGSSSGGGATPESGGCLVGMIYYSDGSCSQYRETDKTAIGVVVEDNAYVMSVPKSGISWASSSSTDVTSIPNYTSSASSAAKNSYLGKLNTTAIVAAYSSDTTSNNAAKYCNSYSTAGTSAGQWYLPAAGELYDGLYLNNKKVTRAFAQLGVAVSGYFWSSSELSGNYAWYVTASDGYMTYNYKGNDNSVSCLLAL